MIAPHEIELEVEQDAPIAAELETTPPVDLETEDVLIVHPDDYSPLANKPKINGMELQPGDNTLTAEDVGALPADTEIPVVPTEMIAANAEARHRHANKAVLDGIDAEKVAAWDGKADPEDIPSVPEWARAQTKPSYTADEVGALPDTTKYAGSASAGGPANVALRLPRGKLDASSTSTVMTAQIPGITELKPDLAIILRNGVVTSAANCTLDINNLGAKPIYQSLSGARVTTTFTAASEYLFYYDETLDPGGCWVMMYGYDSNANTIGYQLRTNSTSLPVEGACYRYRLLFTSADGEKFVPANNSTSTNATSTRTVNQAPINPFGAIRYYGTTAAVSSGSRPGAASLWSQYVITLGYSFNRTGAALALASWVPVYVKCTPQTDGSAIIDPDTPFTQALPSSEDGAIYIFLGIAVSATTVELVPEHPVYIFRKGKIRLFTGIEAELDALEARIATLEGGNT